MTTTEPRRVPIAADVVEASRTLRLPCEDWRCTKDHEWLRTGITAALYHVDEREP